MRFLQNDSKSKVEIFKQFNPTVNRLDDFFFNNVERQLPNELASKKILLILSHRQASVKRSFSVNNTILKENMKCKSITARKTIINHLKSKGLKAYTVSRMKDLLYLVKQSRFRYQKHPRQQRKESKESETATQFSLLDANIKEIEFWKKAFIGFCDSMDKKYHELAKMAGKKGDLNLSNGTAMKRKADEKRPEIYVLESEVCVLVTKKQKLSEK